MIKKDIRMTVDAMVNVIKSSLEITVGAGRMYKVRYHNK